MADPWTEEDPGSVELGCMTNSTSELVAASSKYWNASTQLGTIQATLADWVGLAADAWRGTEASLVASLLESRQRILDGKEAISAYRNATQSIHQRAATARSAISSAERVYERPQPNQVFQPVEFAEWQSDREWASIREQEARNEIYRLVFERSDADDAAIRGLATALPDNWPATAAALASVGISGVGDLSRSSNTDALIELAQRVAGGNAAAAEYDALALLLGMYEHDEPVMSRVFTELGGEKTVDLVDAIGDWGANNLDFAAAALALGVLVRSGLSTGSQSWTQSEANDFVDSMFEAGYEKGDSIAYLFSDVVDSTLGETLAIAAANEIDEFERLNGEKWVQPETGGGLWLGIQEFGNDGNRMSDASGPIFSTLGEYHNAAYEWLTDTADGDRVQYWYHDRYDTMHWAEDGGMPPYVYFAHDGFQGVADLWFGTQQAEGGPIFGGDGPATPQAAAELSSRIMQGLATSEWFSSENVSNAATISLAAGFIANLPGLSHYPIHLDYDGPLTSGAVQGPDGTWTPVVGKYDLAAFLARAGSHEGGAAVLNFGISSYQETLLNMALLSGDPNQLDFVLDRIVDLQGALVGSTQGQLIENAQNEDERSEARIAVVTTVLGALPIPGIGELATGGVRFVLNWAQGIAVGAAWEGISIGAEEIWASHTEQAVAAFADDREGTSMETFRVAMADSLYQYFAEVDPSVLEGVNPPTGDLGAWYGANAEGLQENIANWVPAGHTEPVFEAELIDKLADDYDGEVGDWVGRVRDYDVIREQIEQEG